MINIETEYHEMYCDAVMKCGVWGELDYTAVAINETTTAHIYSHKGVEKFQIIETVTRHESRKSRSVGVTLSLSIL